MSARSHFEVIGRDEPVSPYRSNAVEQRDFDRIRKAIRDRERHRRDRERHRRDKRQALIVWIGIFLASFAFWGFVIHWVVVLEQAR